MTKENITLFVMITKKYLSVFYSILFQQTPFRCFTSTQDNIFLFSNWRKKSKDKLYVNFCAFLLLLFWFFLVSFQIKHKPLTDWTQDSDGQLSDGDAISSVPSRLLSSDRRFKSWSSKTQNDAKQKTRRCLYDDGCVSQHFWSFKSQLKLMGPSSVVLYRRVLVVGVK